MAFVEDVVDRCRTLVYPRSGGSPRFFESDGIHLPVPAPVVIGVALPTVFGAACLTGGLPAIHSTAREHLRHEIAVIQMPPGGVP